jgi:protoheme ferro-lyase
MKKGVLLVNLGSPDSASPKDVKKYLGEFLMDPRVIDVPRWARILLVRGIVLIAEKNSGKNDGSNCIGNALWKYDT